MLATKGFYPMDESLTQFLNRDKLSLRETITQTPPMNDLVVKLTYRTINDLNLSMLMRLKLNEVITSFLIKMPICWLIMIYDIILIYSFLLEKEKDLPLLLKELRQLDSKSQADGLLALEKTFIKQLINKITIQQQQRTKSLSKLLDRFGLILKKLTFLNEEVGQLSITLRWELLEAIHWVKKLSKMQMEGKWMLLMIWLMEQLK